MNISNQYYLTVGLLLRILHCWIMLESRSVVLNSIKVQVVYIVFGTILEMNQNGFFFFKLCTLINNKY